MNEKQPPDMHRIVRGLAVVFVLLGIYFLVGGTIGAAQTGDYQLLWWTVDNGGGSSAGAAFSLAGAVGQPEAGRQMIGGVFALQGGFWPPGAAGPNPPPLDQQTYLPFTIR